MRSQAAAERCRPLDTLYCATHVPTKAPVGESVCSAHRGGLQQAQKTGGTPCIRAMHPVQELLKATQAPKAALSTGRLCCRVPRTHGLGLSFI